MRRLLPILAFLGLLAVEAALFRSQVASPQGWVPPRWNDQLQYLSEAYAGYERAPAPLPAAFAQAFREPTAQGPLHRLFALAALRALGPSRASILTVNLAALLALQVALFLGARRLSGSPLSGLAAASLLGAFQFPWAAGPGSMADYRLDWMAACGFGIALSAAVASRGFRSWSWSLLFGLAAGAAVLTRFILAAYLGIAGILLLAWLLWDRSRRGRSARLVLAAAAGLAVAGPSLWKNRGMIHNYYWVSQLAGPGHGLRGSHLGVLESGVWFVGRLTMVQIGVGAAFVGLGTLYLLRRSCRGKGVQADPDGALAWAPVAAFLIAPSVVLLVHPVKDGQHLSVLLGPIAWAFLLLWRRWEQPAGLRAAWAIAFAAATLSLAVAFDLARVSGPSGALEREYLDVNALSDYLTYRSELGWLHRPRIALTWNLDALRPGVFEVLGFERHGRQRPVEGTLPTGLAAQDPKSLEERVEDSDFVLLVTRAALLFPFDEEMQILRPQLKAWCEAHLRHVGDLEEPEFAVSVYERRDLELAAGTQAPDWGALLRASAPDARPVPPAAPVLLSPARLLASTRGPIRYRPLAAFTPVSFTVADLPEGLHFDPSSGVISGTVVREGTGMIRIRAVNAKGASDATLKVLTSDQPMTGVLSGPERARVGQAVTLQFETLDVDGLLDYLEFTDLSSSTMLGRVSAVGDEKRTWVGKYPVTLREAGRRVFQCRIVRFDPARSPAYSFVDTAWAIEVDP